MFLDEEVKNSKWNIYRCQVCNHVYLGEERPDTCPYCGSKGTEMKDPDLWEKVTSISITDDMKEKLEKAIRMEIEDTVRYEAMLEECKERNELRNIAILRRVSHHEEEHGELIADLIEMSEDEFEELEEEIEFTGPFEMDEFIDHSIDKENEAIKLYAHIHMNTNDPSVSYIFRNLVNAEKKHKEILSTMK